MTIYDYDMKNFLQNGLISVFGVQRYNILRNLQSFLSKLLIEESCTCYFLFVTLRPEYNNAYL